MHFNGLTDKQVEESRKKYGSNVIPDSEPTTFWAEFKETFKDPMIRILLAIAALMIVMCVLGYAEIYEPIGTVVAVLIVAFVSAKTGVASDTKYRQLKDAPKKISARSTATVWSPSSTWMTWWWGTRSCSSPATRCRRTAC